MKKNERLIQEYIAQFHLACKTFLLSYPPSSTHSPPNPFCSKKISHSRTIFVPLSYVVALIDVADEGEVYIEAFFEIGGNI